MFCFIIGRSPFSSSPVLHRRFLHRTMEFLRLQIPNSVPNPLSRSKSLTRYKSVTPNPNLVNQRKIKVKLSGNNAGKRRNKGGVSLYSVAGTDNDSSMLANKDMVNEPSKVVEALPPEKGQLVAVDEELQDPEM